MTTLTNPISAPASNESPVLPLSAGRHGGDVERLARALSVDPASLLDLSASLNPLAPDVTVLARRYLGSLRHYPDATVATGLLAEAVGVDPEWTLLTNGGAEAIALVAGELGGHVSEPEFSLHPRHGDPEQAVPRWRSNPHNPTGRLAAIDDDAGVWDEAFYPLATGRWTRGDVTATSTTSPTFAVVGSLTKLFACPGLRLGYVIAPPDLIAGLRSRQPEWSVGGLALALLPDLLDLAAEQMSAWATGVAALRADLVDLLERHGIETGHSDANFVLAQGPVGLRHALLGHGIVIRDCASFGLPHHVRIAVPDEAGLARLAAALEQLEAGA
jgi:histidinol-phosphate/aromatic aminotransferase/cobyric acid decarboxylase-like protein